MRQLYTSFAGVQPSSHSAGNYGNTATAKLNFPKNDPARGAQQLANKKLDGANYARVPLEAKNSLEKLGFIFV
ncbi:MAG: hypothetical protein LBD62_00555 [Candidatus Margulisbacteria bacterium]|jgi:hypothetical protein|nr:hypothetical protein [Candidatus Margulisiibacteriota bacterium]